MGLTPKMRDPKGSKVFYMLLFTEGYYKISNRLRGNIISNRSRNVYLIVMYLYNLMTFSMFCNLGFKKIRRSLYLVNDTYFDKLYSKKDS